MSAPLSTALPRNTNALFAHASRNSERAIVPINDCAIAPDPPRPAFYCVHSASGVAGTDFLDLARHLEPTVRFYGIQAPPKQMPDREFGNSVESLADSYAAALNKFPFSVVARKEMRNPSDLIGKKIGILNFGGSNDLAVVSMAFKEWNIPRNAATILVSGGAPERLAALMTGAIDATVLSPPETVAASRAGLKILANLSDLNASFPQTLIMVRRSFLANKRETVKRFLRAYSEGIYEFKTNKEKAIKVYANRLKQKDLNILEETYSFYGPKFSFPPRVDRGGINNALELVRHGVEVKGEINLGQFLDESVIDELEREGFFKKLSNPRTRK